MASTSVTFDIIGRDRASKAFSAVGKSADSSASKAAKFGAVLSKTGLAFGAAAVAAGVFTFKVGSSYVASLNQIQALTGATNKQMDQTAHFLESNAGLYAKMGQSTGDAASGVVELTKAGLSLHDALQSVYGTMTLAKAGELSVADASSITANALNTFHLKAKKAGDIANYLANAANISSADVTDIAEAFKYVAPVAASAGVSIQQTNAILAELANSGIKASQAGTTLRTFLLNLEAPAGAAAKVLGDLNVDLYDAQGNLKPLPDVIHLLSGALDGLTQKERNADLKAIFGKTGISGATTILNEGRKGLEKYTKGVEKAGAAQKLAQSRSKGLAGSLDIIKASAKSGAQSIYRQFSPIADKVIRPLAKHFADFATNLGPKLQRGLQRIKPLLEPLKKLAAVTWGKFEDGVSALKKLSNLDFSNLDGNQIGKQLGQAIAEAANTLGQSAAKITAGLGSMFAKVDWGELGRAAGKQVPLFLVGLADGFLNFDPMPIMKFLAKHWAEALFAVVSVAFVELKFGGPIARMLEKIPFVGKFLAALTRWLTKLAGKVAGLIGDFAGSFWKGFLEHAEFPGAGLIKNVMRGLAALPGRVVRFIVDLGETVFLKGLDAFEQLGAGAGKAQAKIVGKVAGVIKAILRPFANAGKWLYSAGVNVIEGLIQGIESKAGELLGKIGSLASKVKSAFKNPMGIFSPSKVFREYGHNLMDGLIGGIADKEMSVQSAISRVTDILSNARDKVSNLMSTKAGFTSTFQQDSIFGTDLSQTKPQDRVAALLATQEASAKQARQLNRDIKRLTTGKGPHLSKSLINQLRSEGASGEAALHALATGDPAAIRRLNRLNRQTNASLQSAGLRAGNYARGGSINDDIRRARKQEHVLELLEKHLKDIAHTQKKDQTIVVEIDGEAVIKSVIRRNKRKGVKTAGM